MHLFHNPQCTIQNRNVHISVLSGALWDMEQEHCEICELGQLQGASRIHGPILERISNRAQMVDFLIGHYTYRIFPPAIDIIPTLLAVVYSNGKYTK